MYRRPARQVFDEKLTFGFKIGRVVDPGRSLACLLTLLEEACFGNECSQSHASTRTVIGATAAILNSASHCSSAAKTFFPPRSSACRIGARMKQTGTWTFDSYRPQVQDISSTLMRNCYASTKIATLSHILEVSTSMLWRLAQTLDFSCNRDYDNMYLMTACQPWPS